MHIRPVLLLAHTRDNTLTMPGVDDIDGVDLMPLETPVLKVSRPVAACSRCRTAKIKCDGKLPVSQIT